ncbi:glycosyltransferase family 2 protein [Alicyclobacillus sendaiensis]|uniref:Glycosyltransferase family 2 protein n=1 Tax=Alicyclobacillus sendaiensis PA2 TaxID=3029425 RepID=A0ABT6XWZ3_ALISE|nr:glycosyltransferase family 2 protein [Alicyclobacillus sendaiensis]MDI9259522.1 glycosyltransferase family 2 protein [Alicyclobacillus sendaiensis PA2]
MSTQARPSREWLVRAERSALAHPREWDRGEGPRPRGGLLSVVVPVFNEEDVLLATHERLTGVLDALPLSWEILYVDDGSQDASPQLLDRLADADPRVRVLHFSRNFGHQLAITAGVDAAHGDAVVVIDADLQDPPEVIPELVAKWREGYDVVFARRAMRVGETWFKRATAAAFYRVLNRLTEVEIPVDVGDFRLMDRRVCDVLRALPEHHRFVRGLVAWMGFRQAEVEYIRQPRLAGESKYPLRRMMRLAMDAVTSFSTLPLRWPLYAGAVAVVLGFAAIAAFAALTAVHGDVLDLLGLALSALLVCTGAVLAAVGLLGLYLGTVLDEVRGRPLYLVDRAVGPGGEASPRE